MFIRATSATPFGFCALTPQDWSSPSSPSSPSSLTSTNVSLLTSPQPEKRKVRCFDPVLDRDGDQAAELPTGRACWLHGEDGCAKTVICRRDTSGVIAGGGSVIVQGIGSADL